MRDLREALKEAVSQIEYLHDRLGYTTATGETVVSRAKATLAQPQGDGKAVAWQFRRFDGKWFNCDRAPTPDALEAKPHLYRPLYTAPPTDSRMRMALELYRGMSDKPVYSGPNVANIIETLLSLRAGDNHASDGKAWECSGCGRVCDDPKADFDELKSKGFLSCCPERKMQPRKIPSDDLDRLKTDAARLGYVLVRGDREALARIKNRIDSHLNAALCEMKPNHDDSISGFNDAWDIVRKVFEAASNDAASYKTVEKVVLDLALKSLDEIASSHIPDCPAHYAGDELAWAQRHVGTLRRKAEIARDGIILALQPRAGG